MASVTVFDPQAVTRVLASIGDTHCASVLHAVSRVDAEHVQQMELVLSACYMLAHINRERAIQPILVKPAA